MVFSATTAASCKDVSFSGNGSPCFHFMFDSADSRGTYNGVGSTISQDKPRRTITVEHLNHGCGELVVEPLSKLSCK